MNTLFDGVEEGPFAVGSKRLSPVRGVTVGARWTEMRQDLVVKDQG